MSGVAIEGKVILITGANRGIGKALASKALELGAKKVYATARDESKLAEVKALDSDRVATLALDVTNQEQVSAAAQAASDVEIVINNAGMGTGAQLMADDVVEKSKLEMDANFYGPMRMGVAFAPILKANGGGAIANVLSVAGLVNFPFAPTYSTSKAAGHSLTQGQRAVLAGQNTLVCGIYPGPIDTDMTAGMTVEKGSTEEVAIAVFEGLAQGTEEIFTDNMARGLAQGMKADAKAVEKSIAAQYQNVR
ncbi:MAG: SDR family oxidoreductase [Pseudomonadota bacterium]|nr:SDR family oxidoreductase [Pseudomonadota bacterium]